MENLTGRANRDAVTVLLDSGCHALHPRQRPLELGFVSVSPREPRSINANATPE